MSEAFIVLSIPRAGTTYNSTEYATSNAINLVKLDGKTREIWKRVAVVEANPKVTLDE